MIVNAHKCVFSLSRCAYVCVYLSSDLCPVFYEQKKWQSLYVQKYKNSIIRTKWDVCSLFPVKLQMLLNLYTFIRIHIFVHMMLIYSTIYYIFLHWQHYKKYLLKLKVKKKYFQNWIYWKVIIFQLCYRRKSSNFLNISKQWAGVKVCNPIYTIFFQ